MRAYPAEVLRVIDGDTVEVRIAAFLDELFVESPMRIAGVDTPEIRARGQAGEKAARFTADWTEDCGDVTALVLGRDKFGRILGDLQCSDGRRLSADLLEAGHAAPYDGGKRGR